MKVFLLHPQDSFPVSSAENHWDLIVDLSRAPNTTYERWSQRAGCPVLSLYQFAEESQGLSGVRQLLQLGLGSVVDSWGIDWWDVLSLEILPQLQQLILLHRLSKELGTNCALYSTRADPLALALQRVLGASLTIRGSRFHGAIQKLRHYGEIFSQLDITQLAQVLEDKFDGDHSIRRRFTHRRHGCDGSVILLPSAYVNVSRTALSYATSLPDHQFLLVLARSNGQVQSLPTNVRVAPLTPYFAPTNQQEIASLRELWKILKARLACSFEPFAMADAAGVLGRITSLLPWGIALRDAWSQVFESENVTACLSADDSNPLSSIPLIMAKQRGLPALVCHHGALDYQMAVKTNHADFYLVKNEMERDYLSRVCHLAPEKIVVAVPPASQVLASQRAARHSAGWLVFFTEPYQSHGWRSEEVYRDLLPRLCSLAKTTGLKLVFKLHPLESVKGHRKMLRRLAPAQEHEIDVIAGSPTSQLWSNTRCALTVQSSTAVECTALGIPVFLCGWLRDPYSGYAQQFARFGVGRVLESPEQIAEIPRMLEEEDTNSFPISRSSGNKEHDQVAQLLAGACAMPLASNG